MSETATGFTGREASARALWRLDSGAAYLNHGGFGATPGEVLDARAALADRIEAAPGPFFTHDYPALLRAAADAVAAWLGADGHDLVFVDNATAAVNAVLRSFPLRPGDEILVTTTTYGAVRNTARFAAAAAGARVAEAVLPFAPDDAGAVVRAVEAAVTPRTRLAVIDHVVSETALVLPVAELAGRLSARGVAVLVDGAHAPGQVPLAIPAIGADWYAANLHKWAFAPRSCGVLWAAAQRQEGLVPPVVSWGWGQGFTAAFDWVGTRDPTPWLAAPAGIAAHTRLGGPRLMAENRRRAAAAVRMLEEAWGVRAPVVPETMTGAMRLVPLPDDGLAADRASADALRRRLWQEFRVEVPVLALEGRLWVRPAAQAYTTPDDVRRLAAAVGRIAR
ncbi:aminotransferase class V-fold PLP-dependent enzyme [Azospirillum halopraeferens]|uniref:aminotransferase class V-fold PLP-dependent enzyme n=1 Tax=Azospirillum halopraeferens TaxID=34010 RepID=UPI000422620B|nr:aminotransferase class V-fold PLP-dependent enzyme [Azospirillum halopraeferens]